MSGAVKIWGHAIAKPREILSNFKKHFKLRGNERGPSAKGKGLLGRLLV